MKRTILLLTFIIIAQLFSCKKNSTDFDPFAENYKGKLPWPTQKPNMTDTEEYNFIANIWIIDNFGTYHATDDKEYLYFHDGLDIVAPNGTRIYAVESGYVKSTWGDGEVWGCITIGNTPGNEPGIGWEYAHVGNFQFKKGDFVNQGDHIAEIYFEGVEHIHFSRIHVRDGDWAYKENREYLHPDKYFKYNDTMPPIIKKPFIYFQNNSNVHFIEGNPVCIRGDVDIVAAMKDVSECVYANDNEYIKRWCVTKIEYEIGSENIPPVLKKSFDFTKAVFDNWKSMKDERVLNIFKFHEIHVLKELNSDKDFAFYNITNIKESGGFDLDNNSYKDCAWNTAELDANNNPVFPNGEYVITVRAFDFMGNFSTEKDTVIIDN